MLDQRLAQSNFWHEKNQKKISKIKVFQLWAFHGSGFQISSLSAFVLQSIILPCMFLRDRNNAFFLCAYPCIDHKLCLLSDVNDFEIGNFVQVQKVENSSPSVC